MKNTKRIIKPWHHHHSIRFDLIWKVCVCVFFFIIILHIEHSRHKQTYTTKHYDDDDDHDKPRTIKFSILWYHWLIDWLVDYGCIIRGLFIQILQSITNYTNWWQTFIRVSDFVNVVNDNVDKKWQKKIMKWRNFKFIYTPYIIIKKKLLLNFIKQTKKIISGLYDMTIFFPEKDIDLSCI